MLKQNFAACIIAGMIASCFLFSCDARSPETDPSKNISTIRAMEHDELVERGGYLVTAGGCNDCHSPKTFDANGMHIDTTLALSGSPAGNVLPAFSSASLQPGNWVLMAPDITSFVGPWGISYAANLTPDSVTGIGTWTKEMFIKALRSGKHMGLEGGRPIMPPMPWSEFAKLKDEDLTAIFTYLQSLPPVRNKVKEYMPPPEAMKMAKGE